MEGKAPFWGSPKHPPHTLFLMVGGVSKPTAPVMRTTTLLRSPPNPPMHGARRHFTVAPAACSSFVTRGRFNCPQNQGHPLARARKAPTRRPAGFWNRFPGGVWVLVGNSLSAGCLAPLGTGWLRCGSGGQAWKASARTLWKAGGCRTEWRACGWRKEAKVKPRASGGPRGGSRGSRQLRGPHAAAESTHWAGQHRSPPPRPWQGTRGAEVRLGVEEGRSWRPAAAAALAPGPAPASPASLAATEGAGAGDVWNHQIFIYQKNPKRL